MNKPIQILYVHGGMTFFTKDDYIEYLKEKEPRLEDKNSWSETYLRNALGKDFSIIKPRFPCQDFAQYDEWKITFEKYLQAVDNDIILMGSSLGGIFLAQYLATNKIEKNVLGVYLVCAPFDNTLSVEDLAGGFILPDDLSLIKENCENLNMFFSVDDEVVPVAHAEKYRKALPFAHISILEGMNGHFIVSEFPQIVKKVKEDCNYE